MAYAEGLQALAKGDRNPPVGLPVPLRRYPEQHKSVVEFSPSTPLSHKKEVFNGKLWVHQRAVPLSLRHNYDCQLGPPGEASQDLPCVPRPGSARIAIDHDDAVGGSPGEGNGLDPNPHLDRLGRAQR